MEVRCDQVLSKYLKHEFCQWMLIDAICRHHTLQNLARPPLTSFPAKEVEVEFHNDVHPEDLEELEEAPKDGYEITLLSPAEDNLVVLTHADSPHLALQQGPLFSCRCHVARCMCIKQLISHLHFFSLQPSGNSR